MAPATADACGGSMLPVAVPALPSRKPPETLPVAAPPLRQPPSRKPPETLPAAVPAIPLRLRGQPPSRKPPATLPERLPKLYAAASAGLSRFWPEMLEAVTKCGTAQLLTPPYTPLHPLTPPHR